MPKEYFYPVKGTSAESIEAELIQKPLMRYLVKGFCKVQQDIIHLALSWAKFAGDALDGVY